MLGTHCGSVSCRRFRAVFAVVLIVSLHQIDHPEIKKLGVDIYFGLVDPSDMRALESATIEHMDRWVKSSRLTHEIQDYFLSSLRHLFFQHPSEEFQASGEKFLDGLSQLILRLSELKSLPDDESAYMDRTEAIYRMMVRHYSEIHRMRYDV
jgi:hypothetical protein